MDNKQTFTIGQFMTFLRENWFFVVFLFGAIAGWVNVQNAIENNTRSIVDNKQDINNINNDVEDIAADFSLIKNDIVEIKTTLQFIKENID